MDKRIYKSTMRGRLRTFPLSPARRPDGYFIVKQPREGLTCHILDSIIIIVTITVATSIHTLLVIDPSAVAVAIIIVTERHGRSNPHQGSIDTLLPLDRHYITTTSMIVMTIPIIITAMTAPSSSTSATALTQDAAVTHAFAPLAFDCDTAS